MAVSMWNSSCTLDCEEWAALGPPPDLILSMPPPPLLPSLLHSPGAELVQDGDNNSSTCNLCRWARGDDHLQLVQFTRPYPGLDDMWYFVIVSTAVGAVLFAVLVVIATLRCKEGKVKPAHEPSCSKTKKNCASTNVPPTLIASTNHSTPGVPTAPPGDTTANITQASIIGPKVLWSSINAAEGSLYSLRHHPVTSGHAASPHIRPPAPTYPPPPPPQPQSLLATTHLHRPSSLTSGKQGPELLSDYEHLDYGTLGHTYTVFLKETEEEPPSRPGPAQGPGAVAGQLPSGPEVIEGVRILDGGNAYYANPDSLDGSFENTGYISSEGSGSVEIRRVAPDGAVVSRKGRHSVTPVHGGGCDGLLLRQRFENEALKSFSEVVGAFSRSNSGSLNGMHTQEPRESLKMREPFVVHRSKTPAFAASLLQHGRPSSQVSSPIV